MASTILKQVLENVMAGAKLPIPSETGSPAPTEPPNARDVLEEIRVQILKNHETSQSSFVEKSKSRSGRVAESVAEAETEPLVENLPVVEAELIAPTSSPIANLAPSVIESELLVELRILQESLQQIPQELDGSAQHHREVIEGLQTLAEQVRALSARASSAPANSAPEAAPKPPARPKVHIGDVETMIDDLLTR